MVRIPFGSACVGETTYRFSRLEKHRTYSVFVSYSLLDHILVMSRALYLNEIGILL